MKCPPRRPAVALAPALAGVLVALTTAAAAMAHAAVPDTPTDPALQGCWRAVRIVLYTQDGSRAEDTSGRCSLRFHGDEMASICRTAQGSTTTTYRYRIIRPQVYAATMQGSGLRTDMVGSTREYHYRVDGDALRTTSRAAQAPAPAAAAASAAGASGEAGAGAVPATGPRVETEAVRMACP